MQDISVMDREQFETVDDGLLVTAPAKINLSLLIAGRRDDGFHEIETLMAKINLYDEIFIQPVHGSAIEIICRGKYPAPAGPENLVYRAAKLLLDDCNVRAGLKISLTKNIPAASGLGSASSDAAATLLGVNKLLKLNCSEKKLYKIAVRLGSDVPFFLGGPLAFCAGKGEKIKKIDKIFEFSALLVLPDVTVSTKRVYENYRHNPSLYRRLKAVIKPLISKNRFDLIAKMCPNMLLESCFNLHKELARLKETIESFEWGLLGLSGSGSAMYSILGNFNKEKRSWI